MAGRVRRIEWKLTGSDFESLLLQFDLLQNVYGPKVLERMHLGAPSFLRYLGSNPYPRITATNGAVRALSNSTEALFLNPANMSAARVYHLAA